MEEREFVECWLSTHETLAQSPVLYELGLEVAHTRNLSSGEVEAGGWEVQSHP